MSPKPSCLTVSNSAAFRSVADGVCAETAPGTARRGQASRVARPEHFLDVPGCIKQVSSGCIAFSTSPLARGYPPKRGLHGRGGSSPPSDTEQVFDSGVETLLPASGLGAVLVAGSFAFGDSGYDFDLPALFVAVDVGGRDRGLSWG